MTQMLRPPNQRIGWNARIPSQRRRSPFRPALSRTPFRAGALSTVVLLLGVLAWAVAGTGYDYRIVPLPSATEASMDGDKVVPRPEREEAARKLRRQLAGLTIGKNYIVVDQANNRLYVRRGEDRLLDAICSSGSGYILREGDEGRTWVFDSPRGEFKVRSKIDKPVWKKPDWAFLEVGEPVPKDPSKRFEYGVLGEHALYFGNGFMIHGTLYERLLGRSVTHGCIRLGRDDLRRVYEASPVGTPIFIY